MKFIIGIATGILLAFIYSGEYHADIWRQINDNLVQPLSSSSLKNPAPTTLPAEPDPQPTPPDPTPAPLPEATEVIADMADLPALIQTPIEPAPTGSQGLSMSEPDVMPAKLGFHNAWMPFRSEASASGFAQKLSRQLDHEFEATRVAAGHYEVRFKFVSEDERDRVLTSIQNLTGYRVPSKI